MAPIEGCGLALYSVEGARSELDLTALAETYSGLLFRVAYSVLRSRAEAEDVAQDVFVRILKRSPDLLTVRDLRVWLIRITWNLSIDRRRRIRPEQIDEDFAKSLVATNAPADEALGDAQKHPLRNSGPGVDGGDLRLSLRQRAGLVDHQCVDFLHTFQGSGILDQHALLRSSPYRDHY